MVRARSLARAAGGGGTIAAKARTNISWFSALALALALGAPLGAGLIGPPPPIVLEPVAAGFTQPITAVHAGDGSGRLFVVEQRGRVWELFDGPRSLYLDVSPKISCCTERGLLGLAFHPDFEVNGVVVISYTRALDGATVLERLVVADPANGVPPANGEVLLVIPRPNAYHNGGGIVYGPDGYLYYGPGDGGLGGAPRHIGQDPGALLGKLLRIDVGAEGPYGIPPTNPFALTGEGAGQSCGSVRASAAVAACGRPEIWALGLRNPWRFTFDRFTGDMYLADVGQDRWEEVNWAPPLVGGQNYGWDCYEGTHEYNVGAHCEDKVFTEPFHEYPHNDVGAFVGCSVTGGYVVRALPPSSLHGVYLFGDFCTGRIWGASGAGPVREVEQLLDTDMLITSFAEGEDGAIYVVDLKGSVKRLVAP